ncbi:hypothetical protein J4729_06260 [Leisingera sp. HS039]|uniref:hypothetical protein n=1 Tax=Leisingera sp. HS039 TaxID=2818496 RepID=UPI001B39E701|nr:hypothetical protein [Leisingera sp. HS039]MBQ4824154.1 hypothetical protein [Leisingera sp. HS039]
MNAISPLFANERNAAKLLDMKPAEFRSLVEGGHLPRPIVRGGLARWDVEQLVKIWRGEAAEGMTEVQW